MTEARVDGSGVGEGAYENSGGIVRILWGSA